MLDKQTNNNDTYNLNDFTKLKVKNVKKESETGAVTYDITVTLVNKTKAIAPLTFSSIDEISDFVNNIDLEDNQMALPM